MSTYYYMVCKDCKEACNAASTSGTPAGPNVLIDSHITLPKFLMFHVGCDIECQSEGKYDTEDEKYLEWSEKNVNAMEDRDAPCYVRDRMARPWAYDSSVPRPMTQAEKDAEAGKAGESLVHLVRDAILKGQAKHPLTTETAAMVIEIVRAHDAKQKAGE